MDQQTMASLQGLPVASLRAIDAVCSRFEQQWRAGAAPRMEDYCAQLTGPEFPVLFRELLVLELEYRQRRGEAPALEQYVKRLPRQARLLSDAWPDVQKRVERALAARASRSSMPNSATVAPEDKQASALVAARPSPGGRADSVRTLAPAEKQACAPGLPQLAGFEVLRELGHGGMGVVYEARQQGLKRIVALKMMLPGGKFSGERRARFRAEAEAIARLKHPNIVEIYALGEHEGQPYFVLEYCPGGSLTRKLDGTPATIAEAARTVELLGRAMAVAHERHIVHRDLKPANVLLTAEGTPKVTDFGLAKLLDDDSIQTQSGAVLGTPCYMAPEQAANSNKIGPPADVYSLGAILYELLTGRPPFKGATGMETLLQVMSDEPVSPSALCPRLARDLETICLKCLQKDPGKRYATAGELADDLQRFNEGRPVLARPVGTMVRLWRWCRRNSAVAALLALAFLLLTSGTAIASFFAIKAFFAERRAIQQADRADREAADARQNAITANEERERTRRLLFVSQMNRVQSAWRENAIGRALELLNEQRPQPGQEDWRHFEWHYWWRQCHQDLHTLSGHNRPVSTVAFSPDGKHLASSSDEGTVKIWESATGRLVRTLEKQAQPVIAVAFNPGGDRLASASRNAPLCIWDVVSGRQLVLAAVYPHIRACSVCFSADGKQLAVGCNEGVQVVDPTTGQQRQLFKSGDGLYYAARYSPDGQFLATIQQMLDRSTFKATLRMVVWETATGKERMAVPVHWNYGRADSGLCFSPDSKRLAALDLDRTIKFWDVSTGREVGASRAVDSPANDMVFTADGKHLVAGCWDGVVRLLETSSGRVVHSWKGHTQEVLRVALSPDGKSMASASADRTVKLWPLHDYPHAALAIEGQSQPVRGVAFSPDSRRLATAGDPYTVRMWDAATGQARPGVNWRAADNLPTFVERVAFLGDGKRLFSVALEVSIDAALKDPATAHVGPATFSPLARPSARAQVWDLATSQLVWSLQGQKSVLSVAASPDGRHLATCGPESVTVWDFQTQRPARTLSRANDTYGRVVFSPDNRCLACGGTEAVVIWDAGTGKELVTLRDPGRVIGSLAFSPDGKQLATNARGIGAVPTDVQIWDLATGKVIQSLRGHAGLVHCVAFSPDGKRLATGGTDGVVRLWEPVSGLEILSLKEHSDAVNDVVFSPDGCRLASAGQDRVIHVWDATPIPSK